jgi:hypothetical protein
MPTGYTVKKPPHATPPDTSSATPVQAANMRRNRLAGCDSEYEHSPAPQVSSTVNQWRSVASAGLALRLGIASAQSALKWKRASLRERIGDQATLLVGQIKRRGFTFDACTVAWRSGVLLKSVILVGLALQAEPETCVRLAERQQQHRTRAG